MNKTIILKLLTVLFGVIGAAKFPSDLERCHYGDKVCLKRVVRMYANSLKNGRRDLNLVSIDPLIVDEVNISQGSNSPVNMNLKFKNMQGYGLSLASIQDVVGFDKDPTKSKFEIYAKVPSMALVGQYKATGNILLLPISGNGHANLTFDNVEARIKFITNVETKKSKQFLRISDITLDFNTTRMWMSFENLFNGDKLLSETTNNFLNENWKEILDELKPVLAKSIASIYRAVADPIFSKFAYSDLFLSDDSDINSKNR